MELVVDNDALSLSKGYKQTEVGLIPSDWEVKTIGEISKLKNGYAFSSEYFSKTGPIVITPGNFKLEGGLKFNDKNTIRFSGYISKEMQFKNGDLLIVMTDLTPDCNLLGKPGIVDSDEIILHNQRIGRITVTNDQVNQDYLYWFFVSDLFSKQMKETATGSTVRHTSVGSINNSIIAIPTKAEQTAIATALSDADALISSLEKLIAKKRNIKQGAMQKLLQPKEGWEVKKLGEVGKCHRGVSYNPERDLHPHDKNITVRLLRSNNVQNQNIDLNGLQYVDKERVKQNQLLQDNDIVICMANGSKQLVGKSATFKAKDKLNYTFGAFMGCFRTNMDLASSSYIALNFQSFQYRNYIDVLLSGSSINNLNPGNIESIEIPFPPAEEQTRIATILSDMDAEIQALETKLEKYRKIKLGMMQNLLTGKIRLI